MLEIIKQSFLAGLGALALTKEAVENVTRRLVEEGKISAHDAQGFVTEMVKEGEKMSAEIQDKVTDIVKRAVQSMNLAGRSELQELEKRVAELEVKVARMTEVGKPSE